MRRKLWEPHAAALNANRAGFRADSPPKSFSYLYGRAPQYSQSSPTPSELLPSTRVSPVARTPL